MTNQPPPQDPNQSGQYAQPQAANPFSMVQLNYWLSVFFVWIPALIFYFVERGKNQQADLYHRENLNFALVRTALMVAGAVLAFIPFIGGFLSLLIWLAGVVLFVFHIIAAAKLTDTYNNGQKPGFIFNVPFISA